MSKANPSQGPGLNKFDSRWRLLSLWGVVFFATFFFYAHTDPIDIFYHLIVDGFFLTVWLISAWGFGRWIVGKGNSLLIHLSRIAIGLGVMSILILLLGLAGWFRDISALLLLALGFLLAISDLANRHHLRKTKWNDTVRQWFAKSAGCHWLLILLAPFAGLMFAGGLVMPGLLWGLDDPSGYDVVEYHLQVPREWFEAGRIIPLHHNVFSFFPFNVEMHYLLAMELHAGPWAGMFLAQWMHGVFIVLTIFAIYAAVRLFASPFAATLAAIGAGFCPWLSMLGAVAYDEGGLLLYTTLAIAWLIVQRTRNDERRMANEEQSPFVRIYHAAIIAGICAGFACGCKLTAVPITLIALPIIFFVCKPTKRALSASLIFGFVGLLAFSPWLIRNQFWANNPVFPEGMSVFSHAYFSPIQIARWHQAHSPRPDQQSIAAHFQAFWEQVISDWQYAYALLPLSILAALTALRRRLAWFLLLIFLAIFLFWIGLTHLESRFFVLAIPMMALLLAVGNPKLLRWAVIPVIFSAIPAFMGLDQRLRLSHLSLTIGLESPTLLRAEIYPKEVNDAIAENKPVILVGDAKAFWFNIPMSRLHYRTVFDVDTSDHRSVVSAWINGAANLKDANVIIDPGELARFHKTYLGIPPLPPSLKYLREPTVFDLHDSQIQE